MKAMILERISQLSENKNPLKLVDIPKPQINNSEVIIKVTACGVCHTELDEIEGRTPPAEFPIILGHQVVGFIEQVADSNKFKAGDRVGVAWIFDSCGNCEFCNAGLENLCSNFRATGRDAHGGYAEYMAAKQDFIFPIPETFTDVEAAPLLCAGAIGYRSLALAQIVDGQNIGLTGFGASAHLVLKMVRYKYPNSKVFVFARSPLERRFAVELGAYWAGDTSENSPEKLHSIIDTTPVWKPIVEAMKNLKPNGRLVVNAIRKENIDKDYLLKFEYSEHLWLEKEIKSVANVTRNDVDQFLKLAAQIPVKPVVQQYSLEDANKALVELKERKIRGAKVLKID